MPAITAIAALVIALLVTPSAAQEPPTSTAMPRAGAAGAAGDSLAALKGRTVVVDPGHNGANYKHPEVINRLVPAGGFKKECDTTGTETVDGRLTEASFTWDVSRRLRKLLRDSGARVVLTRKNNHGVGPCVNERAAIGNRARAAVAISVHGDGGPSSGHGFHVIRPGLIRGRTDKIVRPSKRLALDVRRQLDRIGLLRANYIAHQGIDRRTDLGGLNLSRVPKVFVELGNMQNAGDARRMERASWRQAAARALRRALAQYMAGAAKP